MDPLSIPRSQDTSSFIRIDVDASAIAKNATLHERTKHLKIDYHFIRSKVQDDH